MARLHAAPTGRRQPGQTTPPVANLAQGMLDAAKQTFDFVRRPARKPWISQTTLEALAAARVAEAECTEEARSLRNKAKRLAKKDRIRHIHEQLTEIPAGITKKTWTTARQQKRGFVGRKCHLIVDHKPVPWSKTHEAFRDHLQNQQWAQRVNTPLADRGIPTDILFPPDEDETPVTLRELQAGIAKLKRNKASGPDGVPNELFTLLDADGELKLLDMYNETLNSQTIPPSWTEATVVNIFKGKGKNTDIENYRPISLLNTTYKLFATMLQVRIASISDYKIRKTQFGLRAKRGTRQPLFILRRAMEWAKMTDRPLHLLFLDWKQAFDSIDHTAMLLALKRFGIAQNYLCLIEKFYTSPTFCVNSWTGQTATGVVHAGIRQGCPLSP